MQVFIDTNIFLNFYEDEEDRLGDFKKFIELAKANRVKLMLTKQVIDEYRKKRPEIIKRSIRNLSDWKKAAEKMPIPAVLRRNHSETEEAIKTSRRLRLLADTLSRTLKEKANNNALVEDELIESLFSNTKAIQSDRFYESAQRRVAKGNPPGKKDSLGDAINWEALLEEAKDGNIHIVTADGDFFSLDAEDVPHDFLAREWKREKGGDLYVYKTLSLFLQRTFPLVKNANPASVDKALLIQDLLNSPNFKTTHRLLSKLDEHSSFTEEELLYLLKAYVENDQVWRILADSDVSSFALKLLELSKKPSRKNSKLANCRDHLSARIEEALKEK